MIFWVQKWLAYLHNLGWRHGRNLDGTLTLFAPVLLLTGTALKLKGRLYPQTTTFPFLPNANTWARPQATLTICIFFRESTWVGKHTNSWQFSNPSCSFSLLPQLNTCWKRHVQKLRMQNVFKSSIYKANVLVHH